MRVIVRLLFAAAAVFAASAEAGDSAYKAEPGSHEVQLVENLILEDPLQDRDIDLRVLFPKESGRYPLVVLSAGAFCYPQLYDVFSSHWVSHGYVVITPNHIESPNNAEPPGPDKYDDFLPSRVRDMSYILDEIDQIAERVSLTGEIDKEHVAIAGHSFGAVISMIKIGLNLKSEFQDEEKWGPYYDNRYRAAVLFSAIGQGMDQMADDTFDGIRKPFIATGGTQDVGRVNIGDLTPEQWRMQAFLLAPPGDKHSVITEGSDHYLGGLICNSEMGGEADHAAVRTVRAMTTVFLDAYLKEDPRAMAFLEGLDLGELTGGQATYRSR